MKVDLTRLMLALFAVIIISCSDDEYRSSGEIAGAEFSKMVKKHYVTTVTVWEWNNGYYAAVRDESFTIDGAFLIIGTHYYNFEKLQFFTYDGGKKASIYFK